MPYSFRRPLGILVVLACQSAPPADQDSTGCARSGETPIFEIGLWPGEGVPVIVAARDTLPLRADPLVRSRHAGNFVATGSRGVEYDSTRYQTLRPANARAVAATQLQGRVFGDLRYLPRDEYYAANYAHDTLAIAAGEVVEYLQPRAEGACYVRVRESVIEADPCAVLDATKFTLEGQPSTRWWVYATNGPTSGWLLISDSTAQVVRRTF